MTTLAPQPTAATRVSQPRVLLAEWTKLRTVRSTVWSLFAAMVLTIGLGILIAWARADHWAREGLEDRLTFDPTATTLSGTFLAQLAVGVLGVLVMTGEYATGTVRATFAAVPRRLPVLWAKMVVFAVVAFVLMAVAELIAFTGGQAVLAASTQGIPHTSLSAPHVARAVLGAALYLTVVGLLGLALGALLRHTAGAIATLFGLLLVLPLIVVFLPSNWSHAIGKYLPGTAGEQLWLVVRLPNTLGPWQGFSVFLGYVAVALAVAAVLLVRRDA